MYVYKKDEAIVGAMALTMYQGERLRVGERRSGMKAVRLDALASNTPAHRLYKSLGFKFRGQQHLYAENTGWTDFYFFEYGE